MNVIHDRPCNGPAGLYLDSVDRGSKGEKGEKGETGKTGEKGDTGVSVVGVYVDDDHLMTKLSDGREVDAGELPKVITRRAAVILLDGIARTFTLDAVINPDRVSHILINGVTYTEGFTIASDTITLNFPDEDIPNGKLEIFVNTHSRTGEADVPIDIKPMTDEELLAILNEKES